MVDVTAGEIWSDIGFERSNRDNVGAALQSKLTAKVKGAEYLWAYKSGEWDGTVKLFKSLDVEHSDSPRSRFSFRSGLMPVVLEALAAHNIRIDTLADARMLPSSYKLNATSVPLRKYQYDAIRSAFGNVIDGFGWWPRGVLEIATGGGKTEIAVSMYEMNPISTMFLVHRKDLLIQAKERFEKYGHRVGIIGNGKFEPAFGGITIATLQTINSIMFGESNNAIKNIGPLSKLVIDTKQVFFDECHLMASTIDKGNEFTRVADMFACSFRWGLTATPFMRGPYDNMLLEGIAGRSLHKLTSKMLIDAGYLTAPVVTMKTVTGQMNVTIDWKAAKGNKARAEHWRNVEDKGIKFNEIRTNLIVDEIVSGPEPVLVLVKTIDQAHFIQQLYLARTGKRIMFLSGKDSADDRRAAVAGLRDGSIPAILATTIFDEGVDIPELQKVILASGGKSQVKLLQRVGRGLRLAAGKHEVKIVDFKDEHHSMLKKHAVAREAVWRDQEFEVKYE